MLTAVEQLDARAKTYSGGFLPPECHGDAKSTVRQGPFGEDATHQDSRTRCATFHGKISTWRLHVSDATYRAPDGFLTLGEAGERLGVSRATTIRMTQDGRLPTYRDQRDKRVRLARVEDVERLARLVPAE